MIRSDLYAAIRLVKIRSIVSSGTRIIWSFTGEYFWQCEIFFKNCFLRYVPKDAPYPSQKFYVEGVDVNLDRSDDKSVVVTNVSLKTKGTITCEVGHQSTYISSQINQRSEIRLTWYEVRRVLVTDRQPDRHFAFMILELLLRLKIYLPTYLVWRGGRKKMKTKTRIWLKKYRHLNKISIVQVSSEAPRFKTELATGDLTVVLPPPSPPVLSPVPEEGQRYRVGDVLDVNCTSPGSDPPAKLRYFINNRMVRNESF